MLFVIFAVKNIVTIKSMAKQTYHNDCRIVVYVNFKYSRLFKAYAYDLVGNNTRSKSITGSKIIRKFLDAMSEREQKNLLNNYDEMIQEKLKNGEFKIK